MVVGFVGLIAVGSRRRLGDRRAPPSTPGWSTIPTRSNSPSPRLQSIVEQTETTRRGYLLTSEPPIPGFAAPHRGPDRAGDRRDRRADHATIPASAPDRRLRGRIDDFAERRNATIALIDAGRIGAGDRHVPSRETRRRADARHPRRARRDGGRGAAAAGDPRRRAAEQHPRLLRRSSHRGGCCCCWSSRSPRPRRSCAIRAISARSRDTLRTAQRQTWRSAVAERTADLTRANEEIQRFAYIVSHDLRSPLVNVMGFTAELDAATAALARADRPRRGRRARHRHRRGAARGARGPARGDRLHPHLDAEDGPADQRDPQAVARGPARARARAARRRRDRRRRSAIARSTGSTSAARRSRSSGRCRRSSATGSRSNRSCPT